MSDEKIIHLKSIADEVGIELTYSLGLDPAFDISSDDEGIRKGGVTYLQNIVRKMHVGGGTLLSGVSYAGLGSLSYVLNDKTAMVERSVKSTKEILKFAEECGVTYGVEAVNRFETAVINTAAEPSEDELVRRW